MLPKKLKSKSTESEEDFFIIEGNEKPKPHKGIDSFDESEEEDYEEAVLKVPSPKSESELRREKELKELDLDDIFSNNSWSLGKIIDETFPEYKAGGPNKKKETKKKKKTKKQPKKQTKKQPKKQPKKQTKKQPKKKPTKKKQSKKKKK